MQPLLENDFESPITPVRACRACGNRQLIPILDLGSHALSGRFPRPEQPDPPSGRLALVLCDVTAGSECCGLLQLADTVLSPQLFGVTYGYRSSITNTMVRHLAEQARRATALAHPEPGDRVLDIGCNDGTLLSNFCGHKLQLVGIDPSAERYRESYPSEVKLIVDFFDAERVLEVAPEGDFQIVMSIAMFYDLDDPLGFMKGVRRLLGPEGIWISEQSYEASFYRNLCYDAICHEHVSYFGLSQIEWLAARAGLKLLDAELNASNGGHFTVIFARDDSRRLANERSLAELRRRESEMLLLRPETWEGFAHRVTAHRLRMQEFFGNQAARGRKILGYGASTKGNVVLQYCGITARELAGIAERDPYKYGLVTPGSRIPIISEAEARALQPDVFLVLPWHFRDEIVERERDFLKGGGQLLFHLPDFELVADQPAMPRRRISGG